MNLDLLFMLFQTNIAPSPIPLAPHRPDEEDEDSNNDLGLGLDDDEETESDVVPPRPATEQRSKSNNDRDSAREGASRGTKRPLSPNPGEGSNKAAALGSNQGKVAPMKPRKSLSTLGGRKVGTSAETDKSSKKPPESGSSRVAPAAIAPPKRALKTARK